MHVLIAHTRYATLDEVFAASRDCPDCWNTEGCWTHRSEGNRLAAEARERDAVRLAPFAALPLGSLICEDCAGELPTWAVEAVERGGIVYSRSEGYHEADVAGLEFDSSNCALGDDCCVEGGHAPIGGYVGCDDEGQCVGRYGYAFKIVVAV
jgi:hypothetical protein